ncbi:MAG: hypothetical protein F4Y03_11555 [Alphaproteobacteria bacterium]|nr:hypothetical protein [Alphaproteobacteria bacterium]
MRKIVETAAADGPMHTARTRPVLVAAALLIGACFMSAGAEGSARKGIADKETADPQVTGFRSARFGMSMSETLEAIQRDFQLRREDILEQSNDEDRTSSLVATVTEIFPDSEPAQVVYIHGYKQKKLIQVNILWGSPVTEEPDPQALVTTANILRKYFGGLGFDPGKTVMNTRVDDGAFIVFRATDERERMVLLQLISRKVPLGEGKGEKKPEPQDRVVSLWLSYIEDPRAEGILGIEKGKF